MPDTVENYTVLSKQELERDRTSFEFQGYLHDDTGVSFIWVDLPPGGGPRLHKHAYKEIFIIQEGRVTFRVGAIITEVEAGHVVIVPAGTPHAFTNTGEGRLKQIDIHLSSHIVTEWLED